MRKIKIQDLSNRPVTNVELMTRYVFGDNYPTKFIPGDTYDVGDYVYTVNDNGTVTVYYCMIGGSHRVIDEYNWNLATMPAMILRLIEEYVESGIVKVEVGDTITDTAPNNLVTVSDSFSYKTFRELPREGNIIKLHFNYDELYHNISVWVNGIHLSEFKGDYTISNRRITLTNTISDNDEIVVNVLFKTSPEARLLYNLEKEPINILVHNDDSFELIVPVDDIDMNKSLVFDLYHKGIYVPESMYTFKYDGEINGYRICIPYKYINMYNMNRVNSEYLLDLTCSLSTEISILKNDINRTVNDQVNRFHLDMKYTDFASISEIHQAYNDGHIIPNTDLVLYNSTAHIEDENYYLNMGNTFTISYKNIMINSIFNNDMEDSNDFAQSVHINNLFASTKRIPVPFVDYDTNKNTLMVFNEYGYYVSSTRYYIKDNILTFYPHDESIHEGDTIIFQILNNDYSVGSYMKTITVDEDGLKNGMKLALSGFDKNVFDLLLFTTSGMYITSDMYEISYDKLTLKPDAPVVAGDVLEFVFFEYIKSYTNTTITMHTNVASSDTSLELPFNYLGTRDNIVIFQSDGMYIDSSRYDISTSGVVTLNSGTKFKEHERIEILVSKRYDDTFVLKNVQKYK